MKTLVIYDATGRIWLMAHGEEVAPQGLLCMFVDIPDGATLLKIDVTDLDNPKPVFDYLPETDIGRLQKSMKQLEESASVIATATSIVAETFTDEQALKVQSLYPTWEELVAKGFTAEKAEYRFRYNGQLYKTVSANFKFVEHWIPEVGTESIFTKIEETHAGTLEDPIPASANLEYVKGKYYIENGVIYLMNREGMTEGETVVLQFVPSQLVGQYFDVVE